MEISINKLPINIFAFTTYLKSEGLKQRTIAQGRCG